MSGLYKHWCDYQAGKKAASTLRRYGPSLESLDRFWKGKDWCLVSGDDIWDWANHREDVDKVDPRPGIDALELHATLNALSIFSVANRHTFEAQFRWDMSSPEAKARRRTEITEVLWRYARVDGQGPDRGV